MSGKMQAALLYGIGDVRVELHERPVASNDELLVAVGAVSLCGSDRHYYLEGGIGTARVTEPIILGHEFAGTVVSEESRRYGLEPGSLVAVEPARPCGRCEWCSRGHPNLCPEVRFAGSPPDEHGALAEYAVAPAHCLFPLPPGWTAARGALLEPLGVAIHAVDLARLHPMETVAVLGAGGIGLLMLQVARLAGASRIFVVDPLEPRTRLAAELGADATAADHEPIQDWTDGRGVDVVLEATDSANAARQAAEAVCIGGRLILAGIPEADEVSFSAATLRRKGLTLKMVRRMKHTYPRAIEMVESGRILLDPLITHLFPLERADEAFACHAERRDGALRVLVEMTDAARH